MEILSAGDIYDHVFSFIVIKFKRDMVFFMILCSLKRAIFTTEVMISKKITLYPIYFRVVIFSREHGYNISGNGRYPLRSYNGDASGACTPSLSDA